MVDGQMLKNIPEECIMNIASYLLGTPQQMKFKNSKGLKQIQKKYKLDIVKFDEDKWVRFDPTDDEPIRHLYYGYAIKNRDYTVEEALNIIKRQGHKLHSMIKPNGTTDLLLHFHFYFSNEFCDSEPEFYRVRIRHIQDDTSEELLEMLSGWTDRLKADFKNEFSTSKINFNNVSFQIKNIERNTNEEF